MKAIRDMLTWAMIVALGGGCVTMSDNITQLEEEENSNDSSTPIIEILSSVVTKGEAVYDYIPPTENVRMWCYKTNDNSSIENATNYYAPWESMQYTAKSSSDGLTTTSLVAKVNYYWPETGYIKLFSYYPDDKTIISYDSIETPVGYPKIYVDQPENAAGQVDLLTANSLFSQLEDGQVALQYTNRTAAITFAAAYQPSMINQEGEKPIINITKITLCDIENYNGTFSLDGFTWGEAFGESYDCYASIEDGSIADKSDSGVQQYSTVSGGAYDYSYTKISTSSGVMFIAPQTIDEMIVEYTLKYQADETEVGMTAYASQIGEKFNASDRITIYFSVENDSIVTVETNGWDPIPISN